MHKIYIFILSLAFLFIVYFGISFFTVNTVSGSEDESCLPNPECTQYIYDGEGIRIGKIIDEDNYTLYVTPEIEKEVKDGKVIWRKYYSEGGMNAVRVIKE